MSTTKLHLPKQWTDWTTWLLGIWLCLSPWTLRFEYETAATRTAVLIGILLLLAEVIELSSFRAWEEWINVALGAFLLASTWLVGIAAQTARVNFIVIGGLVVVLAVYEIRHPHQMSEKQT